MAQGCISCLCRVLSQAAVSPWGLSGKQEDWVFPWRRPPAADRSGFHAGKRVSRHTGEGRELVYTAGGGGVLASVNSKDGLETGEESQAETAVHRQRAFFLHRASGSLWKPWNRWDEAYPEHLLHFKPLLAKTEEVGHVYRIPTQQHWATPLTG